MARPSDPKKREKILKAAMTIFADNGYAGARIAEVAETAGIGKGTIYEYFRSKEALFFATFEYFFSETGSQIYAMTKSVSGSASIRLAAVADAVMKTWHSYLDMYGLVMEFWSATGSSPGRNQFKTAFKAEYAKFRQMIGQLIEDGIAEGEFIPGIHSDRIASALIGSWDALLFQAWFDPDFDPLAASDSHMEIVLAGLKRQSANDNEE